MGRKEGGRGVRWGGRRGEEGREGKRKQGKEGGEKEEIREREREKEEGLSDSTRNMSQFKNNCTHTHSLTPQLPPSSLIVHSPPLFPCAPSPAWCARHAGETLETQSQRAGHDTVHTSHLCSGTEHTAPHMFKQIVSAKPQQHVRVCTSVSVHVCL